MNIIISPAKKMRTDCDTLPCRGLPPFLSRTEQLLTLLQGMDRAALKRLWGCNDAITDLNVERLAHMDLRRRLTPALLSYEGIQYQHMAPTVFEDGAFDYLQRHLRILSGFYGLLRPFDGVTPYRLEMRARLAVEDKRDLYAFWGDSLAQELVRDCSCVLNLASKEYSLAVSRHLPPSFPFITCVFGEVKEGRVIEKGTLCKMARGEMVRFMAERQLAAPQAVQSFDRLGFCFDEQRSDARTYVFVRREASSCSWD